MIVIFCLLYNPVLLKMTFSPYTNFKLEHWYLCGYGYLQINVYGTVYPVYVCVCVCVQSMMCPKHDLFKVLLTTIYVYLFLQC